MTEEQKRKVSDLRRAGMGYTETARLAGVSREYIAPVGAVFPPGIPIDVKLLPAPGAYERIHRPLPYLLRMPVPPLLPALPGAERPPLHARRLLQRLPAFPADAFLRLGVLLPVLRPSDSRPCGGIWQEGYFS